MRPLGKIPAIDLYAMSLYKISIKGVLARSLYRSLKEVFWLDFTALYKRSPQKVSVGDLKARFRFKIPVVPAKDL